MKKKNCSSSVQSMYETNPMMGLRGVRLSIVHAGNRRNAGRAIFEAAAMSTQRGNYVKPEVMIPLTGTCQRTQMDSAAP